MSIDLNILLVEDNPGDIRLIERIFDKLTINARVHVATDGVLATEMLNRCIGEGLDLPDLVLLDLNLPKKDGRTVLAEIKQDPRFRHIPVLILTSSQAPADIAASYAAHANAYLVKPMNIDDFLKLGKAIQDFWFTVNVLPACQRNQSSRHS